MPDYYVARSLILSHMTTSCYCIELVLVHSGKISCYLDTVFQAFPRRPKFWRVTKRIERQIPDAISNNTFHRPETSGHYYIYDYLRAPLPQFSALWNGKVTTKNWCHCLHSKFSWEKQFPKLFQMHLLCEHVFRITTQNFLIKKLVHFLFFVQKTTVKNNSW